MLDPAVFFERRVEDEPNLKGYIPELVRAINELKPLRASSRKTSDYINHWLGSKVILEKPMLIDGKIITCFINDPDLSLYNKFVRWMYYYFKKIYNDRTGKTISYAFAYDEFVMRINQSSCLLIENRAIPDLDDVCDEINAEDAKTLSSDLNEIIEELEAEEKDTIPDKTPIENPTNQKTKSDEYIPHKFMVGIWEKFNGDIWEKMDYLDFAKTLNLISNIRLKILGRNRELFFATLNTLSKGIEDNKKRMCWVSEMDKCYANGVRRVTSKDPKTIENKKNKEKVDFLHNFKPL